MVLASLVALFCGWYWWAAGLFVGGYLLQWLGHKVEGNDVGELIPIKKLLGLPVVEFGPASASDPGQPESSRGSPSLTAKDA